MNLIKRIFLILFLFYVSGLPGRVGLISQSVNETLILFFAGTGLIFFSMYLSKFKYKVDFLDILVLLFLIVYPVFSSIVARFTTGQSIYMGVLTFRSMFILFTFYAILLAGFNERTVLDYVNTINIFIIISVIILFLFFNFNDFNTIFRKGTIPLKYSLTSTKGIQFSGYTGLFFISFVTGWVFYFESKRLNRLLLPALIFICSIFITKSRIELFSFSLIPLIMYYLKYKLYNLKFLVITMFLICGFYILIITDNPVSRNFSGLLHPNSLDFAHRTKDYSAYLRIQEIKDGWNWFLKYPVTGLGSISYRYKGGYMGFISDFFFISDIGIFGLLVKGGLILVLLYLLFYIKLINYFTGDSLFSVIGRYLVFFVLIELIIGNDFLYNNTGSLVIIFLLKSSRKGIKRSLGIN